MSDDYRMPRVDVGDTILFGLIPEEQPYQMALVCKAGDQAVDVFWIAKNTGYTGRCGVRHWKDPWLSDHPDILEDGGVWCETPRTLEAKALTAQVAKLTEMVAGILAPPTCSKGPGDDPPADDKPTPQKRGRPSKKSEGE